MARSRLLLVARDAALRARLARLLGSAGYAVELAESAAHARRIGLKRFDLAIVLPDGSGTESRAFAADLEATTKPLLLLGATPGGLQGLGRTSPDATDEGTLLARVAEALRPTPERTEPDAPLPLRFAGLTLDLAGHCLIDRTGTEVPLTRGEFALLREFAQRPGRVLSRDHLLNALAGREAEAYDRSIDMLVSRLRRKVEPDPKRPTLIVTVPGSGYKFTAIVQEIGAGVAARPVPDDAAPERPPADGGTGTGVPAPVARVSDGPTIAVLPFDNLSREPRWDRFCDGLVEDMITDLARHRDLLVFARQSSFAYRGRLSDVREIGRALGAGYVLEGSLQARSGHLRVTAQLIETASGTHVWAERYSREEADLFVIQDEIVRHVAAALTGFSGSILQAELTRARRKPPASLHAYELYLLGYEQEARLDRDGTLRSMELLDEAVRADPNFSRAWTVLGWAWSAAALNGWVDDVAAAQARTREIVTRAAELDPGDSLALVNLGAVRVRDGDHAGARGLFERALTLGPNHADTLALVAKFVSAALGRPEEALLLMERAFSLNPHAPSWYHLGLVRVAYYGRRFELALGAVERAPSLQAAKLFGALALAQLGRESEAAAAVRELRASDPHLRLISAEKLTLCDDARELFLEGVRKAGLEKAVPNR